METLPSDFNHILGVTMLMNKHKLTDNTILQDNENLLEMFFNIGKFTKLIFIIGQI